MRYVPGKALIPARVSEETCLISWRFERAWRSWLVLFCGFSLMLVVPSLVFSQSLPFWTEPVRLDTSSALAQQPTLAALGQRLFVIWSDARLGNFELFVRESPDGGHTWLPEERLTFTETDSVQPALAADPLHLHLVWVERTAVHQAIWYRRFRQGRWEPPRMLAEGDVSEPSVAATSSYPQFSVYVVWEVQRNQQHTAMVQVSPDAGSTWRPARPIVQGRWDTRQPKVAAGPKVAYLVWRDWREGTGQIFFKTWGDYQLGPEVRLHPEGGCRHPTIAVAGEQIAIAWERHDPSLAKTRLLSLHSQDGGRTWSEVQTVAESPAELIRPTIQLASGTSWIFWQDGRRGVWSIFASLRNLRERRWHDAVPFSASGKVAVSPSLTTSGGTPEDQLHAVWSVQETPEQSSVIYRRRDTIPPPPPPAPEHMDLSARPGYDDDDTLTFVWPYSLEPPTVHYRVFVSVDNGPFTLWPAGQDVPHPPVNLPGEQGHTYRIALESLDEVGNASERSEPSAPVTVDQEPPVVQILSPLRDATLMQKVAVRITCQDENLHSWQLMFGATEDPREWIPLADPGRFSVEEDTVALWDLRALQGRYTLRLIAQDQAGNWAEERIPVIVDNRPPLPLMADDGELVMANTPDAFYRQPAWGPQGQIAYISNVGGATDLWVMDLQERRPRRLTQDIFVDGAPDWSPDGQWIAYESLRGDHQEIWVIRADGSVAKPLVADGATNRQPSWSPDGLRLAFTSDRDGDDEIWVLLNPLEVIQGAPPELIRVTDNRWDDESPSWSPNGVEILFQSYRGHNWDLFRIQTDGQREQRLTRELSNETVPRWSPDGKQVLFLSDRERDPRTGAGNVFLLNLMTGEVSLVFRGAFNADWGEHQEALIGESPEGLVRVALTAPPRPLEARLDRPYGGEWVQGQVAILGVARGTQFAEYLLEYRPQGGVWLPLGGRSTAPVERSGFLGALDTTGLEGIYQIRLTVRGVQGTSVTDQVQILVGGEAPALALVRPTEGEWVQEPKVQVVGSVDAGSRVWLNGEPLPLETGDDPLAHFAAWVALTPGDNTITLRARNALGFESQLVRHVRFVGSRIPLRVEAPGDFERLLLPFVIVRGRLEGGGRVFVESDRVSLPQVPVPLTGDGRFERKVLLRSGTNTLTVRAVDPFGREQTVQRRVVYEARQAVLEDTTPPTMVNVYPMPGQVLRRARLTIQTVLVDDGAIDPTSLRFAFDDQEIETFTFDEASGELTYDVPEALVDGPHRFRVTFADKVGHQVTEEVTFQIDTMPFYAGLSASLAAEGLQVVVFSSRPLQVAPGADLILEPGERVYSLTLEPAGGEPSRYEKVFSLSPSQRTFRLRAEVQPPEGEAMALHGYFAYGALEPGGQLRLPARDDGAEVGILVGDPRGVLNDRTLFYLRSQWSSDMERLAAQDLDARSRTLEPYGLVYELGTSEPLAEETSQALDMRLNLRAPVELPLAIFHWNEQLQRWEPLPVQQRREETSYEAAIHELGAYALFYDREPPQVVRLTPGDREEVPLDRFLIQADLRDEGSGIQTIHLRVDGQPAAFEYRADTGHLVYLPSELPPGLHTLELEVIDRAGNRTEQRSIFFTQDVFAFADPVIAYPNPARDAIQVRFRLTQLAKVTLRIYDVTGSLVYTDTQNNVAGRAAFKEYFVWKLENQRGERVAPGVYVFEVEATRNGRTIRQHGKLAVLP